MSGEVERFFVPPDATIREVLKSIDRNAQGIALVVDEQGRLLDTITDGDVRRSILAGVGLDMTAREILDRRRGAARAGPLTVPVGTSDRRILEMMQVHSLRHIPVLDGEGRVADLAFIGNFLEEGDLPVRAVVMAGGFGSRLRPLTEEVPKPMLPVGDRPLLETILERLRLSGIRQVRLATHYKADQIIRHFGDGSDFGLEIEYLREDRPLGTAGALGLMDPGETPLLVMNGDVLTDLDFRAMLSCHQEHGADMTVGVRQYEIFVPYGVVETREGMVSGIREKPALRHLVNAGVYLLEPAVCRRIPAGAPLDMPDLIRDLLAAGKRVACFAVTESWIDVGKMDDYQRARTELSGGED